MQIHELNNFTGTLGSGAYLAIDDGTDTGKISSQGLLAATEARIDNIIAGPAPSAEEIVDARLGADGVTYPSLGDAIRDQFTDVKSDIGNLSNLETIDKSSIVNAVNELEELFSAPTQEAVDNWLDAHPEATTTVQDGSLTEAKFTDALNLKTIKDYVTPEMFGAKGDGVTDDYDALIEALSTDKTVVLLEKTYYSSNSIFLEHNWEIQGINRKTSILKFAEDINGIQLNHSNTISNFTISFAGSGSGLYLYTPDNYNFSLSTVADSLTIIHESDTVAGSFIRLVAQKISDKPYGAYNLLFSNIDCRNKAKYGIELLNKVATTSNTECWFTELKFDSIFFDKVETVLFSDWEDISGNNAVPHTGQASRNQSVKLINVSAQYTSGVSENFAIVRNIRNLELIGCNPFDYYISANQQNHPIFIFNATSDMCVVNMGWMYEFPSYAAIKSYPYISFENSSDYDSDFQKIITYLESGYGVIFGDFSPYNGIMKKDFTRTGNMVSLTSNYGSTIYGYIQIGNVVFLSVLIQPASETTFPANTNLINELLPEPLGGRAACGINVKYGSVSTEGYIRYNGELRLNTAVTTSNALSFVGVYIA